MNKKMSKQMNVALTLGFFSIGGLYLWFITSTVFA